MADSADDQIFEKLRQGQDPQKLEDKAKADIERELAYQEKLQRRLGQLIYDTNSTLPCTISSIRVLNARRTRRSFLERIFNPLLSVNRDRPYTLAEALQEASIAADKLHRFDIFHPPISIYIDRPSQTDPSTTPTDIDIYLSAREKSRLLLKTGTDVGNAEGNAYLNLLARNLFGGAETLNLNASLGTQALGTRSRSTFQATFDTPILSNPDLHVEIGGIASSNQKPWSSHEEDQKGAWTKLRWRTSTGSQHSLAFNGIWRQITGLAPKASASIRNDAGDSVKNSLTHTWSIDQRDRPDLPTSGYYGKTLLELAGWGPLAGDVAFAKAELHTQAITPVPIPFIKSPTGITLTTGLKAGLLQPLPLGSGKSPKPSRINDRFQLGGPTDVRGFRLSGLGPRDGADALGGDVYAAASANLLFPLPRLGAEKPFRFQTFVNGGRLLALRDGGGEGGGAVAGAMRQTLGELADGLPSLSAGVGLVYAHPVARFEVNFSLPLVVRKGEEGRKGVQFGAGMEML